MAPRRGLDGFLAASAKTATARALLAAVAVAVVLGVGGCGGEDSSTQAGTAGAEGSTGSGTTPAGEGKGAKPKSKAAEELRKAKAQAKAKRKAGAKGGRQGPGVPQPKGKPAPKITPEQRKKATKADLTLASPAFAGGDRLPNTYTCDGKDISPPLALKGVPPSASELVLLALNFKPVNESLFFDWAVAGLDPGLTSIEQGKLPAGAVVGTNSFGKRGYSICPPKGGSENLIFMLYAIPKALHLKPGFDPLQAREAVIAQSGDVGLLAVSYGH